MISPILLFIPIWRGGRCCDSVTESHDQHKQLQLGYRKKKKKAWHEKRLEIANFLFFWFRNEPIIGVAQTKELW